LTRRRVGLLAWSLAALGFVLSIAAVILGLLPSRQPFEIEAFGFGLAIMAFPVVGSLIVSRQTDHPIGWLLVTAGLAGALTIFLTSYVSAFAILPGRVWLAWVAQWIWAAFLGPTVLILQLLPDGSVLTRRWRFVFWLTVGTLVVIALAVALIPGPLADYPHIKNPLGVKSLAGVLDVLSGIGWILLVAAISLSAISLIVRYRRSSGERRQQLKWVAFAAGLIGVGWVLAAFSFGVGLERLGAFLIGMGLLALPVALGIAILKYRLYDIDLVINRTLVYGLLTALLVGVYVVLAVGLGTAVRSVAEQENNSVVIAASTLAVAALFGPARRRIQAFIDRRFYRGKYDAARTLEAFSARLREEVDLDSLTGELLTVVRKTMQPAHASLWLREAPS
jgi:MFS family permease